MRLPRLSISGLMALVLAVALDFGIGRALVEPGRFSIPLAELLIIGGFPMGNILAVGLAVLAAARNEPGPRRLALVGFLQFGLVAWAAFLACSFLATMATHDSVRPIVDALNLRPGLALVSFVATLFLLPQVAVAAIGWRLGRRRGKGRP